VRKEYTEMTQIVERMHRRFLDVLRSELIRLKVKDINAVQALLLANISEEEIVIRDLAERGYYQGSNVSYNIKKLVDFGYIEQERADHDKRSVRVRLTDKAKTLVHKVHELEERRAAAVANEGLAPTEIETAARTLRAIERTWSDFIQYGDR